VRALAVRAPFSNFPGRCCRSRTFRLKIYTNQILLIF
jgi:hypothetical protein